MSTMRLAHHNGVYGLNVCPPVEPVSGLARVTGPIQPTCIHRFADVSASTSCATRRSRFVRRRTGCRSDSSLVGRIGATSHGPNEVALMQNDAGGNPMNGVYFGRRSTHPKIEPPA